MSDTFRAMRSGDWCVIKERGGKRLATSRWEIYSVRGEIASELRDSVVEWGKIGCVVTSALSPCGS